MSRKWKYGFYVIVTVIGCADIQPPKNSWIRKDNKQLVVGCVSDDQTWSLKCVGNHWIGLAGNCTEGEELLFLAIC